MLGGGADTGYYVGVIEPQGEGHMISSNFPPKTQEFVRNFGLGVPLGFPFLITMGTFDFTLSTVQ